MKLTSSFFCFVALASVGAIPTLEKDTALAVNIMTPEAMLHWLTTTDAELTFIGKPITPLSSREELSTMVTYCSNRQYNVCGGPCTVYNGGPTCLRAPNTNCLGATHNVAFCANSGCSDCNQLDSCGTRLDNGYCYTPSTNSILVGNY